MAAVLAKGVGANSRSFWKSPFLVHYLYLLVSTGLIFLEPDMGTAMVLFFME